MVCNPNDNTINVTPGTPPSIPGLGPPQFLPALKPPFQIPEGIPEDIIELVQRLIALLPTGIKLQANADKLMKNVWDALASLFNQLAPFLAFFKFIQALLNIIMCIIDVLCSLIFGAPKSFVRLVKECLPAFLAMFPWLALLIMILSIILLLIALIEYIINLIKNYIEQIIRNLVIFKNALERDKDGSAILACIRKLSFLICMIKEVFAILMAVAALLEIIKPLLGLSGIGACSPGKPCCPDESCPPFIANNRGGFSNTTGRFSYISQLNGTVPSGFTAPTAALRAEQWQLMDDNPGEYNFLSVITPVNGYTYWPEGITYQLSANALNVPYTVDMLFQVDPATIGHPSDTQGVRTFYITSAIEQSVPNPNESLYNNNSNAVASGAITLISGAVYEKMVPDADGYYSNVGTVFPGIDGYFKPYIVNSAPATINTFFHKDPVISPIPSVDDSVQITGVQYKFNFNYKALFTYQLINTACNPDVADEVAAIQVDNRSVNDKVGRAPPEINPYIGQMDAAIKDFQSNVTPETAADLGDTLVGILNNLSADAKDYYNKGSKAVIDRFLSTASISPTLQFTDKKIAVTVNLVDSTGTQVGLGIPADLGAELATVITSEATVGVVDPFVYDGVGAFTSHISSDKPGVGKLQIFLNGESIATYANRADFTKTTTVVYTVFDYEFISASGGHAWAAGFEESGAVRRDRTDIADGEV